jgi:glycogen synthase
MRVLMLSWEYPPHVVGGLGKHVAEILPALAQSGVEVHLLTPRWMGSDEIEKVDGATVYRLDPPKVASSDFFSGAWQTNLGLEVKGNELFNTLGSFDVIHAHDWLVAFAACALKRNFKIPLLSTIHATERGRNQGTLHNDMQHAINNVEWWLTYESWRVICASSYMAQEVKEYFNTPSDKVDVVPNGISTERFDRLDGVDLSAFRMKYAAPMQKIVFYVGRLVYEKGLQVLIDAAPRVLAQYPDAKFVIAGTGGMTDSLKQQAIRLGIASNVYLTGFIKDEDRDKLFKVADCAVFPSLYEPFGIVALEAMAAKTPVIVSETGGLREVIKHSETGITVYPGNPDSLAWGILHTLQHPEWAQARAIAAYEEVVRDYNWLRIAQLTKAIYERIARERALSAW